MASNTNFINGKEVRIQSGGIDQLKMIRAIFIVKLNQKNCNEARCFLKDVMMVMIMSKGFNRS